MLSKNASFALGSSFSGLKATVFPVAPSLSNTILSGVMVSVVSNAEVHPQPKAPFQPMDSLTAVMEL